jgi:DNA polymerase-3 subunit delta
MTQTPQEVLKQLQTKKYYPIYFLQGEETYYIDQITNSIEKNILSESESVFNLTVLYGKESYITDIISRARAYPMGADYQIVIVKEAQELSDLAKTSSLKIIESYLKSPQSSTILAFAYKNGSLDNRTAIGKLFSEKTTLVNCSKIYDNQVPRWIEGYVNQKNLTIDTKAVILLHQYVGSNLSLLASEIDKICINLSGTCIKDIHVSDYIGISRKYNIFELQNSLASKDFHSAQLIIQNMVFDGKTNSIVATLGFIFAFFSKLLILHKSIEKSPTEIAAILQINPFFINQYIQACKNYSLARVMQNIEHIHLADLQIKGIDSPPLPDLELLKVLICKLMD